MSRFLVEWFALGGFAQRALDINRLGSLVQAMVWDFNLFTWGEFIGALYLECPRDLVSKRG
tara:strand:+ start:201 stop:383 length:183 start_codon:yes stop_codon:yes gene_type:complete